MAGIGGFHTQEHNVSQLMYYGRDFLVLSYGWRQNVWMLVFHLFLTVQLTSHMCALLMQVATYQKPLMCRRNLWKNSRWIPIHGTVAKQDLPTSDRSLASAKQRVQNPKVDQIFINTGVMITPDQ